MGKVHYMNCEKVSDGGDFLLVSNTDCGIES